MKIFGEPKLLLGRVIRSITLEAGRPVLHLAPIKDGVDEGCPEDALAYVESDGSLTVEPAGI